MTPLPKRGSNKWDKIQTGLVTIIAGLFLKLVSVAGGVYENSVTIRREIELIRENQHEATIERNDIRIHQRDAEQSDGQQNIRLERIEAMLAERNYSLKKNK